MTHEFVRVSDLDIAYRHSTARTPGVLIHGNSFLVQDLNHLLDGPIGRRYPLPGPRSSPGTGVPGTAAGPGVYSLPGYAAVLTGFVRPSTHRTR